MQHPVVAFIDDFRLICVTITQSDEKMEYKPESFRLWDVNDQQLEISAIDVEPRRLHITGDFYNWELLPEGEMIWDNQHHYYFCELPLEMVKQKSFKFIENGFIWYPHGKNLLVDSPKGSFYQKGYSISKDKVRFILKNRMFGFHNLKLLLKTGQNLLPENSYFLDYCGIRKIKLINRDIYNQPEFFYNKADLGFRWTPQQTVFKLWSPMAKELKVLLYDSSSSENPVSIQQMQLTEKGVWQAAVPGDWENHYYLYEIRINENEYRQIDPYSRALSINSQRSLVFDDQKTFPDGWNEQKELLLSNPVDAVIYELHVRDFSISPAWRGPEAQREKYLGLTWSGEISQQDKKVTIGLDHLKELGVNVIQLLPVFDFDTVDETGKDPLKLRNWGYDPHSYNVPEGSYAKQPDDSHRLLEFRQMIMTLHNNGFKVVMDVVYNHTANVGAPFSVFDTFMPEYFYRMDNAGHYTNGSGCGNEIASEKPMVRKYIIDSLRYWLTQYKIDGFRFDLMGLMDLPTMQQIVKELRQLKPDVLIYGEPWVGGASPLANPAVKGSQKMQGFAVFNDHFRDSLRGDTDGTARGWVMGSETLKKQVITGIMGSIDDFTAAPSETINYVSAHDNYTWYDKILRTMPEISPENQIKMARLGLAIILTSQGIPFLHAGSEFLRSKRVPDTSEDDIRNSYKANDKVNQIDWQRKLTYLEFFDYIKTLISIRKKYSALRLTTALQIKKRVSILKDGIPDNLIAIYISGLNKATDLIIIQNPSLKPENIKLPAGIWKIIFDDQYKTRHIQATHLENSISIPYLSTMILELD
ncbi:MAG: type I pullulanase [Candidatus Cloacimonetes bacterium]|nr:type I pullulanase [Candidatus Cloacimonadota bacterium]